MIITGGSGEDNFRFSLGDGHDTITDFDSSQDKLSILEDRTQVEADRMTISHENGNTIIGFGEDSKGSITLEGVTLSPEDLEKVLA